MEIGKTTAFVNVEVPQGTVPGGEGGLKAAEGGEQTPATPLTPLLDTASIRDVAASVAPLLRSAVEALQSEEFKSFITELVPEIDPADIDALASDMSELEALITLLTLEEDEAQAKAIADRIKVKVDQMEEKHKEVIGKIQESIDKAVEAQKAQERNAVLGWVSMALGIVAAIVAVAATVVTGGGSLAVVGCVVACVSAAFTTTQQILEATGFVEEDIQRRAEEMAEESGGKMTVKQAKEKLMREYQIGMAVASGVLALASIGLSVAGTISAFKATEEAVDAAIKVSETVARATKVTQCITQLLGLGMGVTTTTLSFLDAELNFDAAKDQAEVQKLRKLLDKLKQAIEEEQAALEAIMLKMQDSLATMLQILTQPLESLDDIMGNINQGA